MSSRLAPLLVAVVLLCGCAPSTPPRDMDEVPPPPLPAEPAAEAGAMERVELPVGGSDKQALVLAAGAHLEGSLHVPRAGQMRAFGIQLGTYFDTSDGALELRLCRGRARDCATGSSDLALAGDNRMLEITLEPALEVAAGETLQYRLAKLGGTVDVVVWTYPPADAQAEGRVPRLGLYYQP